MKITSDVSLLTRYVVSLSNIVDRALDPSKRGLFYDDKSLCRDEPVGWHAGVAPPPVPTIVPDRFASGPLSSSAATVSLRSAEFATSLTGSDDASSSQIAGESPSPGPTNVSETERTPNATLSRPTQVAREASVDSPIVPTIAPFTAGVPVQPDDGDVIIPWTATPLTSTNVAPPKTLPSTPTISAPTSTLVAAAPLVNASPAIPSRLPTPSIVPTPLPVTRVTAPVGTSTGASSPTRGRTPSNTPQTPTQTPWPSTLTTTMTEVPTPEMLVRPYVDCRTVRNGPEGYLDVTAVIWFDRLHTIPGSWRINARLVEPDGTVQETGDFGVAPARETRRLKIGRMGTYQFNVAASAADLDPNCQWSFFHDQFS